jgi:hypothetical protein
MKNLSVTLHADYVPLTAALDLLSEVAQGSGEVVQRFLDSLDSTSKLFRVDCDVVPAAGAGEYRIVFQPSDLIVEFLSTARAG